MNHSLIIGVDDYPGTDLDLSGCVNDALAWGALLGPHCKTQRVLLNSEATRRSVLGAINAWKSQLRRNDWGILAASWHGTWRTDLTDDEPDGRDEGWVPHDLAVIWDDEVFQLLADRAAGSRILLLTDSCHSGTMFRVFHDPSFRLRMRFMAPDRLQLSDQQKQYAELTAARSRASKKATAIGPGIVHLAACQDTEFAYEMQMGVPRGAFTFAALQALKGMRRGSSFATWHRRIRELLPSYEYPQTPKLNARASEAKWSLPWNE